MAVNASTACVMQKGDVRELMLLNGFELIEVMINPAATKSVTAYTTLTISVQTRIKYTAFDHKQTDFILRMHWMQEILVSD